MTKTKSYLTGKYKNAPWQMQVQNLRRVANRAQKHADWMQELRDTYTKNGLNDDMIVDCERERVKAQAKAIAAAKEMFAIAKANGDPRASNCF